MGGQSAKLRSPANGNTSNAVVKPQKGRYIFQRLTSDYGLSKPTPNGPSVVVTPPETTQPPKKSAIKLPGQPRLAEDLLRSKPLVAEKRQTVVTAEVLPTPADKPEVKLKPIDKPLATLKPNDKPVVNLKPTDKPVVNLKQIDKSMVNMKPSDKAELKLSLQLSPSASTDNFSVNREFVTARERFESDSEEIRLVGDLTVRNSVKAAQTPRGNKIIVDSLSTEKKKVEVIRVRQPRLNSTGPKRTSSKRSQEVGVPPERKLLAQQSYATNSEKIRMFFDTTPEEKPNSTGKVLTNGNVAKFKEERDEVGVYLLSPTLMFSPRDNNLDTTNDIQEMVTPRLGPTDSECNSASTSKTSSDYIESPLVVTFNRSQLAQRNSYRTEGRNDHRKMVRLAQQQRWDNGDYNNDVRRMTAAYDHPDYPYQLEYRRNHVNTAYVQQLQQPQHQQQQYYYDPYSSDAYDYGNYSRPAQYQYRSSRDRSAYESSLPRRPTNRRDSTVPQQFRTD